MRDRVQLFCFLEADRRLRTITILDIDTAKKIYDVNVWGVITTQAFSSLVLAAQVAAGRERAMDGTEMSIEGGKR
jgi:hypothetical protein